jgi:hypothetical protein
MEIMGELETAFTQVDQYNATMSSGQFVVTKDNVLIAAKIIQTQADALTDMLDAAKGDLRVQPPGEDDVSVRIAPAWNDILLDKHGSYANRVQQYIDGLTNLAQQCAESAKTYGYTDEAVAQALGAKQ